MRKVSKSKSTGTNNFIFRNTMNITIKTAEIKDAPGIAILTGELGYSVTESQTKQWLGMILNSVEHCAMVAKDNVGMLYGWVVVEKRVSLETGCKAEISGLVISSNARRLGIGKQLILACESWALQKELEKLVVSSNIKRESSHIFYKNIGFSLNKTAHKYEKILAISSIN
jgi:GNAT superfamily N-acetyltransferase